MSREGKRRKKNREGKGMEERRSEGKIIMHFLQNGTHNTARQNILERYKLVEGTHFL